MSKRVHLPPDERREQIVRGALQVFAEKGFDATTNKEIAKVAGIASPGLIYHYFKNKFDLLRAVVQMRMGAPSDPRLPDALLEMPLEEGLRLVVRHFLADVGNPANVAFIRILIGEAMRRPEFAAILSEVMVGRVFTALTAFFRRHQEQGSLKATTDPALMTLRFAGSLTSILMMREVLRIPEARALDLDGIEDGLVVDFLRGVEP